VSRVGSNRKPPISHWALPGHSAGSAYQAVDSAQITSRLAGHQCRNTALAGSIRGVEFVYLS
jgi:hypothetical protein